MIFFVRKCFQVFTFLNVLLFEICPSLGIHVLTTILGRPSERENRSPSASGFDSNVLDANNLCPGTSVSYFRNEKD